MKEIWETKIEERCLVLNILAVKGFDLNFYLSVLKILHQNVGGTGLVGKIQYPEEFAEIYLYLKESAEATMEEFMESEYRWYSDLWSSGTSIYFYFKNDVDLFYAKLLLTGMGE